MDPHAEDDD